MKLVFQTETGNNIGNCHQAVVASLFELELDQVPNFIKYKAPYHWGQIYSYFISSLNCEYHGPKYLTKQILNLTQTLVFN